MTRVIRKAVLPVAGFGTRVLPGAKSVAKELLNVVDRPIIAYAIAEARLAGIEHFVLVTGRGKAALEDYFDHNFELEAQLRAKGKTAMLEELLGGAAQTRGGELCAPDAAVGSGPCVWCARDVIGGRAVRGDFAGHGDGRACSGLGPGGGGL